MPKMLLEFDPEGSWRSHRFEFCNALEAALDEKLSEESRAAAREALAMYGIKVVKAEQDAGGLKP
jgi:hypothetical protein